MGGNQLRIPSPRVKLINAMGLLLALSAGLLALVVLQAKGATPPIAYLAGGFLIGLGALFSGIRHWKILERSSQSLIERMTVFGIPVRTKRESFALPAEIDVRKEIIQGQNGRRIVHRVYLTGDSKTLRLETFGSSTAAEKLAHELGEFFH